MTNTISTRIHQFTPSTNQQHPFTVVASNPLENELRQALVESNFSRGTITQADIQDYLDNTAYASARADYEYNLLPLSGMVVHAQNTIAVTHEINKLRAANPALDENEFQNLLGEKLTDMLMGMKDNKQLNLAHYQAKNNHKNGYAKFLLYSNSNTPLPHCLQLFVFLPKQTAESPVTNNQQAQSSKLINHQRGQRTKLHNHIAPCASYVLQGTLEETTYCPIEGFRKNSPLAIETGRQRRETGSADGFNEHELNTVHRLENIGNDIAISVHYYREMDGIQHETEKASSLRRYAVDITGKANVANLYRAFKANKPADMIGL
jgi:hypothetical protein